MKKGNLQEVNLTTILKQENIAQYHGFKFFSAEFGFVNSIITGFISQIFTIGQPYRLREGRIMLLKQGSIRISVNLIEYVLSPHSLVLISPNSLFQLLEVSPDFDAQMIAFTGDFIQTPHAEEFYSQLLNYQRKTLVIPLSDTEQTQATMFFALIWEILQEPVFRKEAIRSLITGLLYNIEYAQKSNLQNTVNTQTRPEEIFQRFIALVNTHCKTERTVNFYADKLCLTPRYLNTVIRQTSRQTVMDWINQAIIMEAKVLLKHSNYPINQISDKLNFSNPSFFSKFFKRITGITPLEYQKR